MWLGWPSCLNTPQLIKHCVDQEQPLNSPWIMDILYKQHSFYTSKISKIAHHFLRRLRFNHRALNLQLRGVLSAIPQPNVLFILFKVALHPVLHHHGCFITSCALQCLDDVGWAACAVEVAPCWTCQELSCQEAWATSSLSRGRHGELSHSVVRRPEDDNSLRMSRVITLPVLIRQDGPFSSQSSHLLPSLQWLQAGSVLNFSRSIAFSCRRFRYHI